MLFEEIVSRRAMIIATLVAAACLLVILAGFVLQYRAQRVPQASAGRGSRLQTARPRGRAQRRARAVRRCTGASRQSSGPRAGRIGDWCDPERAGRSRPSR